MEAEISSCQQPGGFHGNIYFFSTGIQSSREELDREDRAGFDKAQWAKARQDDCRNGVAVIVSIQLPFAYPCITVLALDFFCLCHQILSLSAEGSWAMYI